MHSQGRYVSGAFAPNPKDGDPLLLLISKNEVRVLEDLDSGSSKSKQILNLKGAMFKNGERGLENVAIHPNFKENRYVYLFYTKFKDKQGSAHRHNVVARFKMDPESFMLGSREEIWR